MYIYIYITTIIIVYNSTLLNHCKPPQPCIGVAALLTKPVAIALQESDFPPKTSF